MCIGLDGDDEHYLGFFKWIVNRRGSHRGGVGFQHLTFTSCDMVWILERMIAFFRDVNKP